MSIHKTVFMPNKKYVMIRELRTVDALPLLETLISKEGCYLLGFFFFFNIIKEKRYNFILCFFPPKYILMSLWQLYNKPSFRCIGYIALFTKYQECQFGRTAPCPSAPLLFWPSV